MIRNGNGIVIGILIVIDIAVVMQRVSATGKAGTVMVIVNGEGNKKKTKKEKGNVIIIVIAIGIEANVIGIGSEKGNVIANGKRNVNKNASAKGEEVDLEHTTVNMVVREVAVVTKDALPSQGVVVVIGEAVDVLT